MNKKYMYLNFNNIIKTQKIKKHEFKSLKCLK